MRYFLLKLAVTILLLHLIFSVSIAAGMTNNVTMTLKDGIRVQAPAWVTEYLKPNSAFFKPDQKNTREIILSISKANSGDKLIQALHQEWNGSNWVDAQKGLYEYDANGNLTEAFTQIWNDSVWVDYSLAIYTYDVNNFMTEMLYRVNFGFGMMDFMKMIYSFDEVNHIYQMIQQGYDFTSGQMLNVGRLTIQLAEDNLRYLERLSESWDKVNNIWINKEKEIPTYDVNGFRTEKLEMEWDGSAWVNKVRTSYTYDTNGGKLTETVEKCQ